MRHGRASNSSVDGRIDKIVFSKRIVKSNSFGTVGPKEFREY